MVDRKQLLEGIRRVVAKLGTRMVTSGPNTLDTEAMARLAVDIADLRNKGYEIVVVSSGAIAAGMGRMEVQQRPKSIPQLQALASIGQNLLMNAFEKAFGMFGIPIAQVLLTVDDIHDRKRYVNVQNTLNELLRMSVLPVINENDSVGTEEVKVGDNDNLSAYVASLVNADLLVLFTDVDTRDHDLTFIGQNLDHLAALSFLCTTTANDLNSIAFANFYYHGPHSCLADLIVLLGPTKRFS